MIRKKIAHKTNNLNQYFVELSSKVQPKQEFADFLFEILLIEFLLSFLALSLFCWIIGEFKNSDKHKDLLLIRLLGSLKKFLNSFAIIDILEIRSASSSFIKLKLEASNNHFGLTMKFKPLSKK
ncbi:hypothetical protein BpHYR1_033678 [Brachionus plicatilis]|uniref:Uncharacterized protein n=1 Tax=Brachionus plicatilis TaxID=10195 RepID=A0A3M7Q7H0_BRAPC|nr:hypothetical protein BpHYR1_033678 [Brachionus plicatilis]